MADTLKPCPRCRKMLVLLGVLLLGVVAAAWGLWSRIRARRGRGIGWQHWRPASRPAPAAIPASAAADTSPASCTAASPEPGPRRVPDNPPAPEAAAELKPTSRPGHTVEPAAGKLGPPESGAVEPARPQPGGGNAFGPGSVRARSDGSSPEPAYLVKGKIATKMFYTPAAAYYTRTRADVWFRTADDARAAGFSERAPRRHR